MFEPDHIYALNADDGTGVLNTVRAWLGTYICTAQASDLDLLTLWAVHTHLARETYTTPRLLIDSAAPGSGKTTVLDHLKRLAFSPVQAASLTSSALLARILEREPRTLLVDEVDRTLDPKREGVGDLLATLNSGYRYGATRPHLEATPGGTWAMREISTFGPVALAGNSPNLPADLRSRCITVLLLPDLDGTAADSNWQDIEPDALALHDAIAAWADTVRERVAADRPDVTEHAEIAGLRGRNAERWLPLYKVARAAGDDYWPQAVRGLIAADLADQAADKEAGLTALPRHVQLIRDLAKVWPAATDFWPTGDLMRTLHATFPTDWGFSSQHGELTEQAFGRMLSRKFGIRSDRRTLPTGRTRGYALAAFAPSWRAFGITPAYIGNTIK